MKVCVTVWCDGVCESVTQVLAVWTCGDYDCYLDPLTVWCDEGVCDAGAGNGNVDIVILDPHGRKDTVRASTQAVVGKEGVFQVEYVPIDQGLHSINIFFAGSQIPHSPFGVQVAPRKCCPQAFPYFYLAISFVWVGRTCQRAWF